MNTVIILPVNSSSTPSSYTKTLATKDGMKVEVTVHTSSEGKADQFFEKMRSTFDMRYAPQHDRVPYVMIPVIVGVMMALFLFILFAIALAAMGAGFIPKYFGDPNAFSYEARQPAFDVIAMWLLRSWFFLVPLLSLYFMFDEYRSRKASS